MISDSGFQLCTALGATQSVKRSKESSQPKHLGAEGSWCPPGKQPRVSANGSENTVSKNRLLLWLTCLHQGYKCFTKYVCCFALFGFVLFYFFIVFLFDVDVSSSAMARSLLYDFSFLVFVFGLFIQSSVQESGKGNKN